MGKHVPPRRGFGAILGNHDGEGAGAESRYRVRVPTLGLGFRGSISRNAEDGGGATRLER